MHIATERLVLRDYKTDDWKDVHTYAQNAGILQYERWGPNEEKDSVQFVKAAIYAQSVQPRLVFELAITIKSDDRTIGGCRLTASDDGPTGTIGYIINPEYWNRGFATEAILALLDFGQNQLHLKKIEATCDALNIASKKVLEKCGLVNVGLIENDFMMKGRSRDTLLFELIF